PRMPIIIGVVAVGGAGAAIFLKTIHNPHPHVVSTHITVERSTNPQSEGTSDMLNIEIEIEAGIEEENNAIN
ncbi:MAG: hypothetical protein KGH95_00670, partial [Thaumarchaeota archaeon]|nr:hypothetical protein [Nitrososphaerota archaeon]